MDISSSCWSMTLLDCKCTHENCLYTYLLWFLCYQDEVISSTDICEGLASTYYKPVSAGPTKGDELARPSRMHGSVGAVWFAYWKAEQAHRWQATLEWCRQQVLGRVVNSIQQTCVEYFDGSSQAPGHRNVWVQFTPFHELADTNTTVISTNIYWALIIIKHFYVLSI